MVGRLPGAAALIALLALIASPVAHAWGDEGHEVIALIAAQYLSAPVRARVRALLAQDHSALTADTSLPREATWADHFRDSDRNSARVRYRHTVQWHFVNLELVHPSLRQACGGFPRLPAGEPASQGPARDCVVDKIEAFSRELAAPATPPAERVQALQFLLHLVGDLHQPLHAADDQDQGGNRVRVEGVGERPGSLHHYWDTVFVRALDQNPRRLAAQLVAHITPADERAWDRGTPADWAWQSYRLAQRVACCRQGERPTGYRHATASALSR